MSILELSSLSYDVIVVFVLCLIAIVLFATEALRTDLIAILIMCSVALLGIITPVQAVEGFSNPATLTVMNMFILSEAISKTGILNRIGDKILDIAGSSRFLATTLMMAFVGISSMFINNTAAVALMIPITLDISKKANWSPTKILMPISFASMFGGVCTLIGTSTNLLANGILKEKGYETFSMFSFFEYGMVFFVVGFIYTLFVGHFFIKPRRKLQDLKESFSIRNYIFVIKIEKDAPIIGKRIDGNFPLDEYGVDVLYKEHSENGKDNIIGEGDLLRVKSDIKSLYKISKDQRIKILTTNVKEIQENSMQYNKLVEVVVRPSSQLEGKKVSSNTLFEDFNARVIAIRKRKGVSFEKLDNIKLKSGDSLLLFIPPEKIQILRDSNLFVVLKIPRKEDFRPEKIIPALVILVSVISLAAFGVIPILLASFLGVCAMALTKTLSLTEAYKAVNWQVIFLLAGLLALGKAMDHSGAAELMSQELIKNVQGYGQGAIVGAYFLLTLLLTSIMSNNASVALMTPLAIYSASSVGMEIQDLVLTVMFGASMSFLTPVGYQTNTMIYNVGHYKFRDFLLIGGPLSLLFVFLSVFVLS